MLDIRCAISKKLKELYPGHTIYVDKLEQGMKKPCFFVFLRPVTSKLKSKWQEENTVSAEIVYFPADEFKMQDEWLTIQVDLRRNFRSITTDLGTISTGEHKTVVTDGYRYLIELDYIDVLKDMTVYDTINEVTLNTRNEDDYLIASVKFDKGVVN